MTLLHRRRAYQDEAGTGAHKRVTYGQLGSHVAAIITRPVSTSVATEATGIHQRASVAPVRLRPAGARRVHGCEVRVGHDHLMTQLLEVARDPFAFCAGLQKHARRPVVAEHLSEALPCGRDPALLEGAVLVSDAELTLEFVQIKTYREHGWPPDPGARWGGIPVLASLLIPLAADKVKPRSEDMERGG